MSRGPLGPPRPADSGIIPVTSAEVAEAADALRAPSAPRPDTLTLLRDGTEALPAMLAAVLAAEREVLLEMYWLDSTPTGRTFVAGLTEAAQRGVRVCVLYDSIGSLTADRAMYGPLLDAGGKVIEFNPIAPWRRRFMFERVSRRDHRKILVVDGRTGFIGGLNIGQPWAPHSEGGEGWRDDVARVDGPSVERLRAMFFDTWTSQGGALPDPAETLSIDPIEEAAGAGNVRFLGHNSWASRRAIRTAYLSRIRRAKRRIFVMNPYFVPDPAVRRGLERAAERGVDVRVVVPRTSDVPAVLYAGHALYEGMMRAGVHVHEWVQGILHAKTALVDDWATVGSYNLDYRSLRYNLEANLASVDPDFVAAVERSFREDLAIDCEEIDPAVWARRGWFARLRSWAFYLGRKLL